MIFVDESDQRLRYAKDFFVKGSFLPLDWERNKPQSKDVVVLSPAHKWNKFEANALCDGVVVFAGALPAEFEFLKTKTKYINLLENENFVAQNAILTAENFVADLIEHTTMCLKEQKIAVLGSGRVAKAIWRQMNKLQIDFWAYMRSEKELASGAFFAKKCCPLCKIQQNLQDFDVVVNTIPAQIFEKDDLKLFKSGAVIFELASKSCFGAELNFADNVQNIGEAKYVWCSALPAKRSPKSAGKLVFDVVKNFTNSNAN